MATLSFSTSDALKATIDVLLLAVETGPEGPSIVPGVGLRGESASELLADLGRVIHPLGMTGARDELRLVPAPPGVGAKAIALVGVGEKPSGDTTRFLREVAGAAVRSLAGHSAIGFAFPCTEVNDAIALAEGALMGSYAFTRYRRRSAGDLLEPVAAITVFSSWGELKDQSKRIQIVCDAVATARDLVNTSPLEQSPARLALEVAALAQELPINVSILDERDLADARCQGILSVGSGSARPPRLVWMDYAPNGAEVHVALVGKGIVFDAGGISLKPSEAMEEMKSDMAGAATVAGAVLAAARLGLRARVSGWLAIAENLPSATAMRPSDVLELRSGHTIEVINTDAEGRLVLADAITMACEHGPTCLVDVATLTGSSINALGYRVGAVMSNDEAFANRLRELSDTAGEPLWPMPLPEYLLEGFKSHVADMTNLSQLEAGMLAGGVFLKEFVSNRDDGRMPWAHLDIAGPAFNKSAWGFTPVGGTGFAVRTLVALVESLIDDAVVPTEAVGRPNVA